MGPEAEAHGTYTTAYASLSVIIDSDGLGVSTYLNLKVVAFLYSRRARVAFRGGVCTIPRQISAAMVLRRPGHFVK